MRKIYQFALSLAATCLVASTALAQSARVVDLGATSQTSSVWYDSTNDVAWVSGVVFGAATTPTMWSIDEVDTVVPNSLSSLLPGEFGAALAISRNGAYVSGETVSAATYPEPEGTLWVFGQWNNPQATGYLPGYPESQARAVANDGSVTGRSGGGYAFTKSLTGPITALATLPGSSGVSVADGVSADGSVCVGGAINASGFSVATKWTNGGQTVTPLDDPVGLFSGAGGISPDGSMQGGIVTDLEGAWASAWINDTLTFITNDQGQKFFGQVNGVTDDGTFVGNGDYNGTLEQKAFVWNTSWPHALTMEAWLQQNGVANPPSLSDVTDIYHDGSTYHFSVEGTTSSYYIQTDDVDGEPEPTFDLSATPNPVQAGQWVSFKLTGGTPGYPGIMLHTKRNGNPLRFLSIVGIGFFNSNGEITFNRWMPWWFHGTKTYQGITAEQGYTQLLYTPEMDLVIQ